MLIAGLALSPCSYAAERQRAVSSEIECVNPDRTPKFVFRDIISYRVLDGIVVIEASTSTVLYSVPVGTACEIRPVKRDSITEITPND